MAPRISKVRRRGLTAYKLHELLTGKIMYPMMYYDGYGDGGPGGHDDLAENHISDAMRQDWAANREALLAFWKSGKIHHDRRACGVWPQRPHASVAIRAWLARHAAVGRKAVRLGTGW